MNDKLAKIQQELHCPKTQFNAFAKYNYRSCEGILEAVKPLLAKHGCTLTLTDSITECGGWVFIAATATLFDSTGPIAYSTAAARHEDEKKGMDSSQVSGACSSYARKYALNGLFLIDDNRDSDATNDHGKELPTVKPITAQQVDAIQAAVAEGPHTTTELVAKLKEHDIPNIREIPAGMYKNVLAWAEGR